MSADNEYVLTLVAPKIARKDTQLRKAISPRERLAMMTLRFLATGDSYGSLQYLFEVSKASINNIIPEVCLAIIEVLRDHIKMNKTPDEWKRISERFHTWNFPNYLGVMNGKHVILQVPIKSGSEFFNYKSSHSIVMFALVDADYNIFFLDVGIQGRISDGGIFKKTELHQHLMRRLYQIDQIDQVPYVIVANEKFPLEEYILKPYSGNHPGGWTKRIFNYQLSRARRIVENVFGIMSARFRVLREPLLLEPEKAQIVIMAIAYLHNFLRRHISRNTFTPYNFLYTESDGLLVEGQWRREILNQIALLPMTVIPRRSTRRAQGICDEFAQYFVTTRALAWQNTYG